MWRGLRQRRYEGLVEGQGSLMVADDEAEAETLSRD